MSAVPLSSRAKKRKKKMRGGFATISPSGCVEKTIRKQREIHQDKRERTPKHSKKECFYTDSLILCGNTLVGFWESVDVLLDVTLVTEELNVGTIYLDATLLSHSNVFFTAQRGEAPVLADDDLLTTRELVHGTTEGFDGGGAVSITGANTDEDLADVHAGNDTVGFTEGTTHTGLESIGSGARQHLVDADDVVRVSANAEMETFFTGSLDKVSESC